MGLKSLYYLDAAMTWFLFVLGVVAVPFGIGGFVLVSPIEAANLSYPWYHGTGIWIGLLYLVLAVSSPFAMTDPLLIKLSLVLLYVVVVAAGVAIGIQFDEIAAWFENPDVEIVQLNPNELQFTNRENVVKTQMDDFDYFHKIRVGMVMFSSMMGLSLLLYRSISLGLMVLEELVWYKQIVLLEEEQTMYEAIAEYQMQSLVSSAQTPIGGLKTDFDDLHKESLRLLYAAAPIARHEDDEEVNNDDDQVASLDGGNCETEADSSLLDVVSDLQNQFGPL